MSPTLDLPALDSVRVPLYLPGSTQMSSITPVDGDGWRTVVAKRIQSVGRLPADWDTYNSPSPSVAAAHALVFVEDIGSILRRLLPPPGVSPTSGGGVGLSWTIGNRQLEIEVQPTGGLAFVTAVDEDVEDEGPLPQREVDDRLLWLLVG